VRENSLISWLQQLDLSGQNRSAKDVLHGIGDDAAVLRTSGDIVVTTDLICDGTHFKLEECTPRQIGRKAIAVNLSDIAAMAARPTAAFVSLLLPSSFTRSMTSELMLGLIDLASEFECSVAGGDTNVWQGKLVVNVVIIGKATNRGPLLRNGAQPGDVILVTGALGGSLAGHHLNFQPRVQEALQLHEKFLLHAGMDLSDGLAMDLARICQASGCGAEIHVESLPISSAVKQLSTSRDQQFKRALGDGEDFELLIAAPEDEAARIVSDQPLNIPITAVGHFLSGSNIWLNKAGNRWPLPHIGYEHGTSVQ